jgi:hypothetical protein
MAAMRCVAVSVIVSWSVAASAQPAGELAPETKPPVDAPEVTPAAPVDEATAAQLTARARVAARRGECAELAALGERVRELDPTCYETTFATDRGILSCVPERVVIDGAPTTGPLAPMPEPGAPGDRSPALAGLISIGMPVTGVLLASAAARVGATGKTAAAVLGSIGAAMIVVGPTLGHTYAGRTWNPGLKWRLITLGVAAGALIPLSACTGRDFSCNGSALGTIGVIGLLGAGLTHLGATAYEMFTAPGAARRANERGRKVEIVPAIPGGAGVRLVGQF